MQAGYALLLRGSCAATCLPGDVPCDTCTPPAAAHVPCGSCLALVTHAIGSPEVVHGRYCKRFKNCDVLLSSICAFVIIEMQGCVETCGRFRRGYDRPGQMCMHALDVKMLTMAARVGMSTTGDVQTSKPDVSPKQYL